MAKARGVAILLCWTASLGMLESAPGRIQLYPAPTSVNAVSLARDRHGLVWVAARQGIFRFDGLHYHVIPGYPFRSAQFVAVEPGDTVWVGGPQGLARYDNSEWKTVLTDPIEGMAMGPAGLWVNCRGLGLFSAKRPARRFDQAKPTGELQVDGHGALWFPCGENVCTMLPPDWRLESRKNPAPGSWRKIVPENNRGRYWASSLEELALVENGVVRSRQKAEYLGTYPGLAPTLDPDLSPGGVVWATQSHPGTLAGLGLWETTPINGDCSLFAGEFTRWFCAGDKLGKSERALDWETWSEPFNARSPEGFLERSGEMPLLFTDRGVLSRSERTRAWTIGALAAQAAVMNMIDDGFGGYWLATKDEGLVRAGKDFRVLERFPKLCPAVDAMRALLRDGRGRTWAGGKVPNCFFEVKGGPGKWKFIPQKLPESTVQTVDLQADGQGRPWVGYANGLAYLDDSGEWRRITTSEPVTLVRAFDFDGKDAIWVTHRLPGSFTRLERKGDLWQVRRFSGDRYGASHTEYLRRDSRGWIWRGRLTDVQVARPGRYEPGEWLRLTYPGGMASVGVSLRGWSEDQAGNVFLAGNGGVTRVHPTPEWFDAPRGKRPLLTRVSAGGRNWLDPERMPNQLPAGAPVEVDLSGMDANPFQAAPLRYRLAGSDWRPNADGRLRFAGLANGSYTLEAAYSGDGAADILRWDFQVGSPAPQYLFPALGLGAIGLLALWGWRRDWLQYRVRKTVFLIARMLRRREESVPWTNYAGRTLVRRYEVSETISRGGFSVTYRARDRQTGDQVVVKVLHRRPGQERWMRHRFAHEVAAMHTVSHQGVVRLLDSWIAPEGEPCLVMPYLDGPTLRELLTKSGPLNPARVAGIVQQLGTAVGAIHAVGIVHRDLKPENVIVTGNDQAVVIDFGTSAARGPEGDQENTVTLTGSLHYLAPERLAGQYSPASDVYSLGVMALEMLSGKRPAEMEVAPTEPEFLRVVSGWAGEQAAEKIIAALRHQPGRRPPDVNIWSGEVARLLREFSENEQDGRPSI